jgi:hypothetical protein
MCFHGIGKYGQATAEPEWNSKLFISKHKSQAGCAATIFEDAKSPAYATILAE